MQYVVLAIALLLAAYNWWMFRSLRKEMQRINPDRLSQLVDELVATAEEATAAVAERTERLQAIINKAQTVGAELKGHVARAAAAGGSAGEAETTGPDRGRTPTMSAEARRAGAVVEFKRIEEASARPEPAQVGAGAPRVKAWEPAELSPVQQAPPPDRARAEIYALADAGVDSQGIARKLGMTRGEVELILGLRRLN